MTFPLSELPSIADLEASLCRQSFWDFVRLAWPIIEPARELMPSVAVDALCAVLQEAALGGQWTIACPPGVSKSTLVSVAFPAWMLLRTDGKVRMMTGAYSGDRAKIDSMKCRDLVTSPWYVGLTRGEWALREDVGHAVDDWWTTSRGRRVTASVKSGTTGDRVNVQVIDDPLAVKQAYSAAARRDAARWINEVLPSRLDDPLHDTRIVVGQRVHPEDPIGLLIEQGGWNHLRVPALAEDEPTEIRRADGSLIWRDTRKPGQPTFALQSVEAMEKMKVQLGSVAFAAQYQQRPSSDESAMFRRHWPMWYKHSEGPRPVGSNESIAVDLPEKFDRVVIAADLTFGSEKGDYAVAQAWGAKGGKRYLLSHWRARAPFEAQVAALRAMKLEHPKASLVIEKAAFGKAAVDMLRHEFSDVVDEVPQGSKEQRAASVVPDWESGSCYLPEGAPFTVDVVDELCGFGNGAKHDDIVDTQGMALRHLKVSTGLQRARALGTW